MNPSYRLLAAHLRRQEARIEQLSADLQAAYVRNAELQRRLDNTRRVLSKARKGRDEWKRRALAYRYRAKIAKQGLEEVRAGRDLWRHRALTKTPRRPAPRFPQPPIEWVEDEVA